MSTEDEAMRLARETFALCERTETLLNVETLAALLRTYGDSRLEAGALGCEARAADCLAAREEQYAFEQRTGTHNGALRAMYTDKAETAQEDAAALRSLKETKEA